MITLGLTGSIGMGKSTTARMFAEAGVAVYDADAVVHRLYGGAAVPAIEARFPGTARGGVIDRRELSNRVLENPTALAALEAIVHPLVRAEEAAFLGHARGAGLRIAMLDIPLLFEVGGTDRLDAVVVVTAPKAVQRARVLSRDGMTEAKLNAILAKQMPDADKRQRAHFVIDTGRGFGAARAQVRGVLRAAAGLAAR